MLSINDSEKKYYFKSTSITFAKLTQNHNSFLISNNKNRTIIYTQLSSFSTFSINEKNSFITRFSTKKHNLIFTIENNVNNNLNAMFENQTIDYKQS